MSNTEWKTAETKTTTQYEREVACVHGRITVRVSGDVDARDNGKVWRHIDIETYRPMRFASIARRFADDAAADAMAFRLVELMLSPDDGDTSTETDATEGRR